LIVGGWQVWSNEASCLLSAVFHLNGSTLAGKPTFQEITMEKSQLDLLMEKLEGLERANRRWKRGVTVIASVVGLGLLMGQAAPKEKTVQAERFELIDASGKVRGEWSPKALSLRNEDGAIRLGMFSTKEGGTGILMFADDTQKRQISMMMAKDGFAAFGLNDDKGKTRAMLANRPDGKPSLLLQDETGQAIFSK
jgi:hypothetical protein